MPQYLCLLYAPADADGSDPERVAEIPEWMRLTDELRQSGALLGNNPLQAVHAATTVRVRDERRRRPCPHRQQDLAAGHQQLVAELERLGQIRFLHGDDVTKARTTPS